MTDYWHDIIPIEDLRAGHSVVGLGPVNEVKESSGSFEVRFSMDSTFATFTVPLAAGTMTRHRPVIIVEAGAAVCVLRRYD